MQFWIDLGKAYQGKLFPVESDLNLLSFGEVKVCLTREAQSTIRPIKDFLASTC